MKKINDVYKKKSGFRQLILDSGNWQYKVGKGNIIIFSPTMKRINTDQSKVSRLSWDELERGYWKGWFSGITPAMIKFWIECHCFDCMGNIITEF